MTPFLRVYLPVDALVELAPEELDAHDGEDEPKDETDQQHVDDGGDGVHQGVHHDLNAKMGQTREICLIDVGIRTGVRTNNSS